MGIMEFDKQDQKVVLRKTATFMAMFQEEHKKKNNNFSIRSDAKHTKNERSLMTPGMRYDVLKRDNFKCQYCGATMEDGIKVHVDHIYPIAMGGRTVMDNLQTLCETCNRGKGAKI